MPLQLTKINIQVGKGQSLSTPNLQPFHAIRNIVMGALRKHILLIIVIVIALISLAFKVWG